MAADQNKAALAKLREAYTRAQGVLGTLEQAKKRPPVVDDDLLTAYLGMATRNVEFVRDTIAEVGKMLKG